MSYLHSDNYLPDANVIPSLNVGHSLESMIELAGSFSSSQRLKVFAGYAGWSPGQLDDEMKRDTWLTHPASIELIFNTPPEKLWQAILGNKGWRYRLLSEAPEDLSWN